jgi:hypothetical protein
VESAIKDCKQLNWQLHNIRHISPFLVLLLYRLWRFHTMSGVVCKFYKYRQRCTIHLLENITLHLFLRCFLLAASLFCVVLCSLTNIDVVLLSLLFLCPPLVCTFPRSCSVQCMSQYYILVYKWLIEETAVLLLSWLLLLIIPFMRMSIPSDDFVFLLCCAMCLSYEFAWWWPRKQRNM